MTIDGLTTIASSFGASETIARLEAEILGRGLTIFARIDHAAGAAEVGMTLRPTTLIIFGNARGGTPLMEAVQTAGIDLPLKALVWEDAGGETWITYNEPGWVARRHSVPHPESIVNSLSAVLTVITRNGAGVAGPGN